MFGKGKKRNIYNTIIYLLMRKFITFCFAILAVATIISCSEKKAEEPAPVKEEVPPPPEVLDLAGAVSKYPVVMHIEIDGKNVEGQYYYRSSGPDYPLQLSGTSDQDGNLDIHETNDEGQPTGHFMGQWDGNEFTGEFVNFKGQHFPFRLVKNEDGADIPTRAVGPVTESSTVPDVAYDVDDEAYSDDSSDSGSEDWDAVLDAYERYVDRYISLMKKAQAGDATALAEYPGLLQEANEYSNKLENASGELSSAQMARYQRITNKMLKAAQ